MATKITIFESNSVTITAVMSLKDLTGYQGTFYVKKFKTDDDYLMSVTGTTTTGDTMTFTLTTTDTDIPAGNYQYEIRIVNGSSIYTTNQGILVVLDSLATHEST